MPNYCRDEHQPWRTEGGYVNQRVRLSVALAQEHVVRGIGYPLVGRRRLARSLGHATLGVDALDGCHGREGALAAVFRYVKLEPRDVVRRRASRGGSSLSPQCASVHVLPIRSRVMASDGLSVLH